MALPHIELALKYLTFLILKIARNTKIPQFDLAGLSQTAVQLRCKRRPIPANNIWIAAAALECKMGKCYCVLLF